MDAENTRSMYVIDEKDPASGPTDDPERSADSTFERREVVLALAMQSSRMGAWQRDVEGGTVWWSEELEEIFGLEKGSFGGTEAEFFRLIHEDDRETSGREIEKAIAEKRSYQFEFRFIHADGSIRWMEGRGQAIYNADGEPVRLYGVGIDITERKEAEERAQFLSSLAATVQEVTDPAEIMSLTARMLGDHLGVDRCAYAEVESESVFVITGDYVRGVPSIVGRWPVAAFGPECVRQMLANEPFVVFDSESDPRIGPADLPAYQATTITAVICLPLHKDGKFTAAMAVHQKTVRRWTESEIQLVSLVVNRCWESLERTRAVREVKESEERFRLALSSGAITVYEQDADLRYKWVYPEGPYRSDLIGKTDDELTRDPAGETRTRLKRRVLETGTALREEVSAVVEGRERWYDLIVEPRHDTEGTVVGIGGTALDITERKEAELERNRLSDELAASEARFRSLMEQAPFSIQLFEPDGHHVRVNRAWEELWGINFEQIPDYNILRDSQLEARGIAGTIRRAFAGEAVELPAIEYDPNETLPGATGNADPVRWVSAIAYPLKSPDGQVTEVALIHQDITAKTLAENARLFQKTVLEALIESVQDGILIVSPSGEMLQTNQRFIDIWKFPGNIMAERSDSAALEWAAAQTCDPEAFLSRVNAIYQRPDQASREEVIMKDGRFLERYGAPVFKDSERLGWVWTFRDISERKSAEERLRESENNLRSLADTIPQLAWMAEPDGTVSWYNQRWYEFTGTAPAEMEGEGWQSVLDPKERDGVVSSWQNSVATGNPFEMEFRLKRADGVFGWFLTRVNPLRDTQGNIIRWFGTNTDITKIREAEESLKQTRNELEQRVADRTKELAETNQLLVLQIEERVRAEKERFELLGRLLTIQDDERGRIARDIHDELGQRVTAFRLKTASIMELCGDNKELTQRVTRLQEIAEKLDHEITFIAWELRPSVLDDLHFVEALKDYLVEWSRRSNIKSQFHTKGLADMQIDHDIEINVYRIAQEALNNAAKHSKATVVSVLLERRGGDLLLIIEDDGVGLDTTKSRPADGKRKGFGIAGMRERAILIGGKVEIESEKKGTTVFVRVPLSSQVNTEHP